MRHVCRRVGFPAPRVTGCPGDRFRPLLPLIFFIQVASDPAHAGKFCAERTLHFTNKKSSSGFYHDG